MFIVRYELNFYILFTKTTLFEGLREISLKIVFDRRKMDCVGKSENHIIRNFVIYVGRPVLLREHNVVTGYVINV
jgi:hypothetical protein